MRIALAQLISGADPYANLDLVADAARRAAEQGADLLLCPEATMRCFGLPLLEIAEPADGPWARRLAGIADEHALVIVAGMFTPSDDGRVRNTLRIVGGGIDAAYDKIHLFDAFGFTESDTVAPGEEVLVVEIAGVDVGFALCYDLRFPGLFTTLADRGAQLICVAASWAPGPGKVEQWELLARARALDSTCFIAAVGQADPATLGIENPTNAPTGVGHSAVVSPVGTVLGALGGEPGLLVADLDPADVQPVRQAIPVLANRRL
ncbi:putative hydrolase [Microlunatus phosphovorus NM-1]|uniref:Putative hydrolase n=1 Tax=Microlunatus phosphovorus (strain ATCC 700054 / DSM 10555 / JCM 9379 / NBRC 101784 / NCIMB 13414 / VKM Ac-1990 / NM-1) TaxID=1032480 RepID=F5XP26_MICPN|nr:carbon-nitrogen hydrolase family protein [Microlunatus phosphovorus]BAK36666.1 putative hydrolase [Microlunatus phosphovorus NM-1]